MTGITAARSRDLRRQVPTLAKDGTSVREIARQLGCARDTVKRILGESGSAPRSATEQRVANIQRRDVPLRGELSELVTGLLLGDGGIELQPGRQPRLHLTNGSLQYVHYVADRLRAGGVEARVGATVSGHHRLWTRAWPSLGPFAALWYTGGTTKRRIPESCALTRTSLLHWWIGDGSLARHKGKRPTAYLYTNSFHEADVRRIAAAMTSDGIRALALRCGGVQRHEWRIHLNRTGITSLIERIGDCPVSDYAYKWAIHGIHRPEDHMAKTNEGEQP